MNTQELIGVMNTPYAWLIATSILINAFVFARMILCFRLSQAHKTPLSWTILCAIGITGSIIVSDQPFVTHDMWVCTLPFTNVSFSFGLFFFTAFGMFSSFISLGSVYLYHIPKAWDKASTLQAMKYALHEEAYFYTAPFALPLLLIKENIRSMRKGSPQRSVSITAGPGLYKPSEGGRTAQVGEVTQSVTETVTA
jgi:hypothetical protein